LKIKSGAGKSSNRTTNSLKEGLNRDIKGTARHSAFCDSFMSRITGR